MPDLGSLLRVLVSLGLVLALLWVAARALQKGRAGTARGVDVDVLARVPLAQKSSLAVVRLGEQALVLGITEHRVELLTQTPVADVADVAEVAYTVAAQPVVASASAVATATEAVGAGSSPDPAGRVAARRSRHAASSSAPLAGSALSPQTWTKAVAALREMTVRQ